jgi:hypothetical protein
MLYFSLFLEDDQILKAAMEKEMRRMIGRGYLAVLQR